MDSLKERNMADEYIYFDVESFHQFLEFIIGTVSFTITLRTHFGPEQVIQARIFGIFEQKFEPL